MATPETLKTPETPEAKQELKTLKLNVSKDYEKFENLSKSPVLKKGMEKIMKKALEWEMNFNSRKSVDEYTSIMIEKHPELISFIVGELNLPVKMGKSSNRVQFSQLSFEQKMKFKALVKVYWDNENRYGNINSKKIIDEYRKYMDEFTKKATDSFNKEIDKNKNIVGLVDLEKVLKNTYGLTDSEYKKMKEYLEIIQKHPEYVGGKMKPQEAGNAVGYLLVAGLSLLLGVIGTLYIQNVWRMKPTETRIYGDHTELVDFKKVFQVMSAYAKTDSKVRDFEEDGIGEFDETTGTRIEKTGKTVGNVFIDAANTVQRRKLSLQVKTEIGYFFDTETATCSVERKNGKGIFHVKLKKKPDLKFINVEPQILDSRREWINMSKFDDFELKCINTLKDEAMEEAKKPEEIKKAENSFKNNLLSIFKSTGYASSGMVIDAKDVQDVIIEYEN